MNKPAVFGEPSTCPSASEILSLTSAAVYSTDAAGLITFYNEPAVALWGIRPVIGETRWCGSWEIYTTDGEPLPHDQCPMAVCLKERREVSGAEIVVARSDGSRSNILVNPRPIFSPSGELVGAVNTMMDVSAIRREENARKRSESFSQHVLANSPDCIKVLDLDGRLETINACGCVSLEIDDPSKAKGLSYFDFWKGEERTAAIDAAAEALKSGSGRFSGTFTSTSGKTTVWDEIITTLPDENGRPTAFVVVSRDMTERHNASDAMARRLAQQSALAEIGSIALSEADFGTALQHITEILSEAVCCSLTKVLQFSDQADHLILRAGIGWKSGLVGAATVGVEQSSQAGYTLLVGTPVVVADLEAETRFSGPALLLDHGVRSGMSVTIPGSEKRPFGVLGVHSPELRSFEQADIDFLVAVANVIAARWRQEDAAHHRALLLREMAHRSGNLLQLANSIFIQTIRFSPDIETVKSTFSQRLAAMARTNMMIAHGGWGKTSIRALAEQVFEPFSEKFRLSGRDVVLPAEFCFDLGLIWHELSTNSAKYGALAANTGMVEVSWALRSPPEGAPELDLVWQDSSVAGTRGVKGSGFGMKLLSQLVEKKHSGTIEVENDPTYRCKITVKIAENPTLPQ